MRKGAAAVVVVVSILSVWSGACFFTMFQNKLVSWCVSMVVFYFACVAGSKKKSSGRVRAFTAAAGAGRPEGAAQSRRAAAAAARRTGLFFFGFVSVVLFEKGRKVRSDEQDDDGDACVNVCEIWTRIFEDLVHVVFFILPVPGDRAPPRS
jgi:hypothetical protein